VVYDPPRRARGSLGHQLSWCRRLASENYDAVFDLLGTPLSARWTLCTGARLRVGRRRRFRTFAYNHLLSPTHGPVRFAGDVFLDFSRSVGAVTPRWEPVDFLSEPERGPHDPPPTGEGPWVVLHFPATWSAKAWPTRHWIRLAKELASRGLTRLELSWGPGEEAERDEILGAVGSPLRAMPATSLPELARRLRACDLMITTDSGPRHIAVAMRTPTLTLFGSTNPEGWHQPDPRHAILFHEVECRPCDLTRCVVPGHPCLDDLSPVRVCEEAMRMLGREESA
jgi:ADP-heptose:LPS heptosyltransferase